MEGNKLQNFIHILNKLKIDECCTKVKFTYKGVLLEPTLFSLPNNDDFSIVIQLDKPKKDK